MCRCCTADWQVNINFSGKLRVFSLLDFLNRVPQNDSVFVFDRRVIGKQRAIVAKAPMFLARALMLIAPVVAAVCAVVMRLVGGSGVWRGVVPVGICAVGVGCIGGSCRLRLGCLRRRFRFDNAYIFRRFLFSSFCSGSGSVFKSKYTASL